MSSAIRFRTHVPTYRQREGRSQALVTLTDAYTRKRRDYWLGEYGTPESRQAYHRVIAAWEAGGRRLPNNKNGDELERSAPDSIKITELILEYWKWAQGYYHPTRAGAVKTDLRLLRQHYGETAAIEFGPNKLRALRDAMITGDRNSIPTRPAWSRRYINSQVQCLRHVFKWAAARELVPASVHQSLCTLEPLRRGRSDARENPKVGPVPHHLLDAVRPHLNRPVRAVVELQLLTGARPGELLGLRPMDIEINKQADVWIYQPESHKNAYRDKERIIYLGPRAQEILRPFLSNRSMHAFLFSPAEADTDRRAILHAVRKTPLSCGNRPGTNRIESPRRKPRDRYSTESYCRAIKYACDKAFPPPEALGRRKGEMLTGWNTRLTPKQRDELKRWYKIHRWHPHQLRHNAATLLRREFGLEAAQLALGHASANITDAIYAERDQAKVIDIMRRIG